MPMNATTLGAAIKTAMVTNLGASNPSILGSGAAALLAQADLQRVSDAIATAVVAHIQASALVTLAVGCLASGVTAGAATAPVTGTGTIT